MRGWLRVAPARVDGEVEQSLVHCIGLAGVGASTSCNGLDALALSVSQQSHGVDGKRTPAAVLSQDVANPSEILLKSLNPTQFNKVAHNWPLSSRSTVQAIPIGRPSG